MKRTLLFALTCTLWAGHAEAQCVVVMNGMCYSAEGANGFNQEDIQRVGPPNLVVEVSGTCPQQNDDPIFPRYPLDIARGHAGGACARPGNDWSGVTTGDLWVNRCTVDPACTRSGPNPVLGASYVYNNQNVPIAVNYFSVNDANDATLAQLDWWLGGQNWATFTNNSQIPEIVYLCLTGTCSDGGPGFVDEINNGDIPAACYPSTSNCSYYVPTSTTEEYVVMPPARLVDDVVAQSYVVELDYERADTTDLGTVSFLSQVSSLLQNTTELPHAYNFSVRSDEIVPPSFPDYRNTNSWLSGLDQISIPQIMRLPGFAYFSIFTSASGRYTSIPESWLDSLTVVNGGLLPQRCSPVMQHVMMDFDLNEPVGDEIADARTANGLLASWCVPIVQPDFNGGTQLGGPNCLGSLPVIWPDTWGALIGEGVSCGPERKKRPVRRRDRP